MEGHWFGPLELDGLRRRSHDAGTLHLIVRGLHADGLEQPAASGQGSTRTT
jgi:hypothetical protein